MRRLLLLSIALIAVLAPLASAASWTRVTDANGSNIDQVALLRTPDGVLHVVWRRHASPTSDDIMHTAISAGGKVGATTPIQSGWAGVENPALVSDPGGIRAFWGGQRSLDSSDPLQEMATAVSADGGASWALQPSSVVGKGTSAYASDVSATLLANGTPLQAWAGSSGTWAHAGLTEALPNHDFQAPLGTYGYFPNVATDTKTGQTWMAWYSNATGHLGVYAQSVAADGSPVGSATRMPKTADLRSGMLGRTPIAARSDGGVYVAELTHYPSLNRVELWRIGSNSTKLIGKTGGSYVTVAPAADGRLWVVWFDGTKIYARRSNTSASGFGAKVAVTPPRKASSGYRLDASAAGGALDVFGTFTTGSAPGVATYYRRILPGLTLEAASHTLHKGKSKTITFTVSDAGPGVKGAVVKAQGKSATTDAHGEAKLTLTGKGKHVTVKATAPGYRSAKVTLKVKKK